MEKKYYNNDLLKEINYYSDIKNFDKALSLYQNYKELYPNDKSADITYGEILTSQKKYDEAEKVLEEVINDKLRNERIKAKAMAAISTVYYYQNRFDEAKKCLEACFNLSNYQYTYSLKLLCEIYSKEHEFDTARALVKKYKTSENENFLNIILSDIEIYANNYEESLNILLNLNEIGLSEIEIQRKKYNMAKNYYCLGDYDQAEKYFKECLKSKNIFYWVSYFYIACIKSRKGYIDEAIRICEDIKKHDSSVNGVNDLLTSLYLKKNNTKKTIEIIDDMDNIGEKLFNLAKLKLQNAQFIEAEELFIKAYNNVNPILKERTLYFLAVAKFKQGKYNETMETISKINNISLELKKDIARMKYYINYINGNEISTHSYTAKQIVNYNSNLALSHIYSKHSNDFNKEIDIEQLFYNIKDMLKDAKKNNLKCFDIYYLTINNLDNNYGNTLTVACVPNTYNILTMYPESDLNIYSDELEVEEEVIKTTSKERKLSQIDKFNKKYGL